MGEFNSDDHYIYYCGQESLRRNGLAIMVTKEYESRRKKKILLLRKHIDKSEFTSYEFLLYIFCYQSLVSDYLFLNFLLIIRQELAKLEIQR